MKTFSRQLKVMIALAASIVCLMALKAPGYDENGQDINECIQEPCPPEYICVNLPGSYICMNHYGEVGGEGIIGYEINLTECSFEGTVDEQGYVTLFGTKKFVGLPAGSVFHATYNAATLKCILNGRFQCSPVTCGDFWKTLIE